ncbi:hypothetical protein BU23DRAFT_543192 [Bimuria novae-zelandiae CBS 107.79]|uniref:Small secreted protein n=1 Tax=Bimuria novae-zelandiae CBS 107.79 TaxID=1447943 RepID=A0A6A5UT47_9PLEO|nr:hypothetical protein BU23DRAFT_543192 [Bimuria novae-zelandiae CBS 107.79]
MRDFVIVSVLVLAASVVATLDPATTNTNGKFPTKPSCSPVKTSKAIQAAECSHNTRTSKQTFAVFTTDHKYDKVNGAPYGTCEAYNCDPGTAMTASADAWTFFWSGAGECDGEGVGCIKNPVDGMCGCENSDGTFVPGGSNCE